MFHQVVECNMYRIVNDGWFLRVSISNLFSFLIMTKSKKQNMEPNVFRCSFEFQVHYSWCLIYDLRLPFYG